MQRMILVVDDAEDFREMCALFLSLQGYSVVVASDGQEAVKKAFEILPGLVLMDLALPVVGGLEAIKQIKDDQRTRHIPIILMTGHVRRGPAAVIEAQCEGFLVKPCGPKGMVEEIERVLNRARREVRSAA